MGARALAVTLVVPRVVERMGRLSVRLILVAIFLVLVVAMLRLVFLGVVRRPLRLLAIRGVRVLRRSGDGILVVVGEVGEVLLARLLATDLVAQAGPLGPGALVAERAGWRELVVAVPEARLADLLGRGRDDDVVACAAGAVGSAGEGRAWERSAALVELLLGRVDVLVHEEVAL